MDELEATVQKIVSTGRHGPYAVAGTNLVKGSITFSLGGNVWQEKSWPESGSIVVLSQLVKKEAGWRAMRGRFLKPSDEAKSNQQKKGKKTMNVCRCCYDPEIISDRNPFVVMNTVGGYILVPDDTPVEPRGYGVFEMGDGHISHEVLEAAGLKWDIRQWKKPDGSYIDGPYDISVTED